MNSNNFNISNNHEQSNNFDTSNRKSFIENFVNELKNSIKNSSLDVTSTFYTIDRIEDNFAICENIETSEILNIPLSNLPKDIKETFILKFENGSYSIDYEKTKESNSRIANKFKDLFDSQN